MQEKAGIRGHQIQEVIDSRDRGSNRRTYDGEGPARDWKIRRNIQTHKIIGDNLLGLHLVEDGLGELVGGGVAAHVASADLAVGLLVTDKIIHEQ